MGWGAPRQHGGHAAILGEEKVIGVVPHGNARRSNSKVTDARSGGSQYNGLRDARHNCNFTYANTTTRWYPSKCSPVVFQVLMFSLNSILTNYDGEMNLKRIHIPEYITSNGNIPEEMQYGITGAWREALSNLSLWVDPIFGCTRHCRPCWMHSGCRGIEYNLVFRSCARRAQGPFTHMKRVCVK